MELQQKVSLSWYNAALWENENEQGMVKESEYDIK